MSYRVNGWDENYDSRTGEKYYSCPECGWQEGSGHDKKCPRYFPGCDENNDDED